MAKKQEQAPEPEAAPKAPKVLSPYKVVHALGMPCGAKHGRCGQGWGPVDCPGCLSALGLA